MGDRLRPSWTYDETIALLEAWGEPAVQDALRAMVRNYEIYEAVAEKLRQKGFDRTAAQCRLKIKNLKAEYRVSESGDSQKRSKFAKILKRILDREEAHEATPVPPPNVEPPDPGSEDAPSPCDPHLFYPLEDEEDEEEEEEDEFDEKDADGGVSNGACSMDRVGSHHVGYGPSSSRSPRFRLPPTTSVLEAITRQFLRYQEEAEMRYYEFERERMRHEAKMEEKRMAMLSEELQMQKREDEEKEIKMMQVLDHMFDKIQDALQNATSANPEVKTTESS